MSRISSGVIVRGFNVSFYSNNADVVSVIVRRVIFFLDVLDKPQLIQIPSAIALNQGDEVLHMAFVVELLVDCPRASVAVSSVELNGGVERLAQVHHSLPRKACVADGRGWVINLLHCLCL